jgi:hypothetical protein
MKRAYSRDIEVPMRYHINYITKLGFLPEFEVAFDRAFHQSISAHPFEAQGLPFSSQTLFYQSSTFSCVRLLHRLPL